MGRDEHVGVAEAAARLGVSRQRLHVLRQTYADFPEPFRLAVGLIWHAKDIDRWAETHPRLNGVRLDYRAPRSDTSGASTQSG